MDLTRADLESALELVRRIQSASDLGSFHRELLAGLRDLIPCDLSTYDEMNPADGTALVEEHPMGSVSSEELDAFERYMDQHPLLAHIARTGDGSGLRLSDFIDRRRLRRLDLWDGVFRPLGVDYQIAFGRPSGRRFIAVSLKRGASDFSDRERDLLGLLGPHVAIARDNAELRHLHLTSRRLPEHAPGAVGIALVAEGGTILTANRLARKLLVAYFDGAARAAYLPEDLERWVCLHQKRRNGERLRPTPDGLRVQSEHGSLTVRLLPGSGPSRPDTLFFIESVPRIRMPALRLAGLSPREIEVLALLREGLRNAAIARELSISPATVKKHLENCYRKLDVDGRVAAVARVQELSRGRGPRAT